MSLRDDFNTPAFDDPTALHHEPLGNGAGLSDFHTVNVEESERSNTPKIVGAVAVALMVGVAAVGLYANMGHSTKPVVADNTLPKTVPVTPPQQTAMAAPDSSMSTPAPDASAAPTPAPAPEPAATKTEPAKPAPVHTASRSSSHIKSASSEPASSASDAASVRMSADTTQTTQAPQQAQVTPQPAQQAQATPLPAAPAPSPSDVASNGGQSSAAVPNNATTASDIPQAAPAPAQPQAARRLRLLRPSSREATPARLRPSNIATEMSTRAPVHAGARFSFAMKLSNAAQNWARMGLRSIRISCSASGIST